VKLCGCSTVELITPKCVATCPVHPRGVVIVHRLLPKAGLTIMRLWDLNPHLPT
jgi:hypothetical protein